MTEAQPQLEPGFAEIVSDYFPQHFILVQVDDDILTEISYCQQEAQISHAEHRRSAKP